MNSAAMRQGITPQMATLPSVIAMEAKAVKRHASILGRPVDKVLTSLFPAGLLLVCLCGCFDVRAKTKSAIADNPNVVVAQSLDTAKLSDAIAKQVELANSDPGRRDTSSAVAQSILTFGPDAGIPADYVKRMLDAVPKIKASPPEPLTTADIDAIRKVK